MKASLCCDPAPMQRCLPVRSAPLCQVGSRTKPSSGYQTICPDKPLSSIADDAGLAQSWSGVDLAHACDMQRISGAAIAAVLLGSACQHPADSSDAASTARISIPRADWPGFVQRLDLSLRRIVPEVRDPEGLVAVRYFCTAEATTRRCEPNSPSARLGLLSGDRLTAVNGRRVSGSAANVDSFLHDEMQRSADDCSVSFGIESPDGMRSVGAYCE